MSDARRSTHCSASDGLVCASSSHRPFRVPGDRHLALRVTCAKQPKQLLAPVLLEAFVDLGERSPTSVERNDLPSAMGHRLVLHPAAALVELGVARHDDVEGVGHVSGVGQRLVEGGPMATGQVEGRVDDFVAPRLRFLREPTPSASCHSCQGRRPRVDRGSRRRSGSRIPVEYQCRLMCTSTHQSAILTSWVYAQLQQGALVQQGALEVAALNLILMNAVGISGLVVR